ncbi:MAG: CHAD domain-containing protein [Xanthobacteraceae bacterium]
MSHKPALRPDLAVGEALRAVARDILATARAAIEDPARPDATAVHEYRKEMKRWRAVLRLLAPFLKGDAEHLRAEARDLARALSGARDSQAALDALADLGSHGLPFSARSLATLRQRIGTLRQARETTALTTDMRLRLIGALDRATAAADQWPLHLLTSEDIAGCLARGYRAARRAMPDNWAKADADSLHEFRKRIINHRYQMEIMQPLWRRFGKMWIAENQQLRDHLGQHQDLMMLEGFTTPNQPLARWRSRLSPAIADRKRRHVAAARRLAKRLFVEKPGSFRRRLETIWETG